MDNIIGSMSESTSMEEAIFDPEVERDDAIKIWQHNEESLVVVGIRTSKEEGDRHQFGVERKV